MIPRDTHVVTVSRLLDQFPVVALLGARQVGQTTLVGTVAAKYDDTTRFDLEDPRDETRLAAPMLALEPLRGLVVLDEIQRRPDLFPLLRVLADRPGIPARVLLLGSASPELMRASADSLAGRVAHHELPGLGLAEVGEGHWQQGWVRGGDPRSLLAGDDQASLRWRQELIRTLLERDLPAPGLWLLAETQCRLWQMLAHYHGQFWNGAELARAFGVSEKTVVSLPGSAGVHIHGQDPPAPAGQPGQAPSALTQGLHRRPRSAARLARPGKPVGPDRPLQGRGLLGGLRHRRDHRGPRCPPRGVQFLGAAHRR